MFHTVPEGEQVVIYSLGRFNRIDGPGLVQVLPRIEEIRSRLDVRERQYIARVKMTTGGVPVELELHYRARLDLVACAPDRARQAELASWEDAQRIAKREDSIYAALVQVIKAHERANPPPPDADIFARIAHILPGSDAHLQVVAAIQQQVDLLLRQLGYLVIHTEPFYLKLANLPERLLEELNRDRADRIGYERRKRIWQDMLTYIQDWPPHLKAHMLAIVEQLEPPPITIPIPGADQGAQINTKLTPAGVPEIEVQMPSGSPPAPPPVQVVAPPVAPPGAPPVAPPAQRPAAPVSPAAPPGEPSPWSPHTAADVAVLKSVPSRPQPLRRSG